MARAQYADIVLSAEGRLVPGATVSIAVHPGAEGSATFYTTETGNETTPTVVANALGYFSVWLEEGRYDVTLGSQTKTIDVINQSSIELDTPAGVVGQQRRVLSSGPSWVAGDNYPLELWQGLKEGNDWKKPLEAALTFLKEGGKGGTIKLAGPLYEFSEIPTWPSAANVPGAIHLDGSGKFTTIVRVSADAGAGNFAFRWQGTSETERNYCNSRISNLWLQGSQKKEKGNRFAMSGFQCARRNQFANIRVTGFHDGFYPYGDHITWEEIEASENKYGFYYGPGPENLGGHYMWNPELSGNDVASFGCSQTANKGGTGTINRAGPTVFGGSVGFSEYVVLIEASAAKKAAVVFGGTFVGTGWEAPGKAWIDETPDSEGKRWAVVENLKLINSPMNTDNVAIEVGMRCACLNEIWIDTGGQWATTHNTGTFFSCQLLKGLRVIQGSLEELFTREWKVADAVVTDCWLEAGGGKYQLMNVGAGCAEGNFVTFTPRSRAGIFTPPGDNAEDYMLQNAAPITSTRQPVVGMLQKLYEAGSTTPVAVVRWRGKTAGTGATEVNKKETTEIIKGEEAVYLTANGSVSKVSTEGPQVGYATSESKSTEAKVKMSFDVHTMGR